jgi:uncharacterized RDD family membrane protein YckC
VSRAPVEDRSLEGNYAGAVTRLAAYAADTFFMVASYGVVLAVIVFVYNLAVRSDEIQAPSQSTLPYLVGLAVWIFVYNGVCWAMWWKTPGKALLGLRVVERDGSDLRVRTAFRRALWWQLCFLVPFSQIGIIVGQERRALHDVLAGTTVVYDWNARDARWRMMARHNVEAADDRDVDGGAVDEPGADRDGADHGRG